MERTKYILIFIFCLCFYPDLKSNYRSDIYDAYDFNDMKDWKKLIDKLDSVENKADNVVLELVNYQYGYIAWCIGNKKNEEAETYLARAEKNIENLESKKYNLSMINAYKSAFYGYRIGLNTLLAPFIGLKSSECAKMSIKLDSTNPFGFIQYANIQFYMPAVFGGSKAEALKYYLKAKMLMEKKPGFIPEDWNYISLLTIIGKVYWALDDLQTTKIYFENIMKITRKYDWVKKEMYPQLLNEINSKE
jgi:hypothetical protein